jgi:hypothetical protein
MKKFAAGGRADAMRERRMADIEKDYQKALAKGKGEKEAQAKRDQRIADAKDDYAKRTGADRTETRAAEKAAESKLSATRRGVDKDYKPVSVTSEGSKPLATAKMDMPKVSTPNLGRTESKPKVARSAPRRAAAPAPAKKPAFNMQALRDLEAEVTRPKATQTGGKDKGKDKGKDTTTKTFGQRQQAFFDQLGEELATPFRRIRAAGRADDKARGFAKGGKVDGCAVRGKTKAMRKK